MPVTKYTPLVSCSIFYLILFFIYPLGANSALIVKKCSLNLYFKLSSHQIFNSSSNLALTDLQLFHFNRYSNFPTDIKKRPSTTIMARKRLECVFFLLSAQACTQILSTDYSNKTKKSAQNVFLSVLSHWICTGRLSVLLSFFLNTHMFILYVAKLYTQSYQDTKTI